MSKFLNKKVPAPVAIAVIVLVAVIAVIVILKWQIGLIEEELWIPNAILIDK